MAGMERIVRHPVRAAVVALAIVGAAVAGAGFTFATRTAAPLAMPTPAAAQARVTTPAAAGRLAAACASLPRAVTGAGLAGVWTVAPETEAGYRAHEKFAFLQSPHEAVARTSRVAGWARVTRTGGQTTLEESCFAIDVTSLVSIDQLPGLRTTDRDDVARGILQADRYPIVTFKAARLRLPDAMAAGDRVHFEIPGELTIAGVHKPAALAVDARVADGQLSAAGRTVIAAGDYGLDLPKAADFVSVESQITLEVALLMHR
jgi:polyisoprenoid-binding protein YceI